MRIKEKWRKRVNGSVSIFLVLVLLPMFTMAGVIVDMSRISASNVVISGAGDLAMNAALSDYEQALKDVYGIFAMSAAAGDEKAQKAALTENLERYFNNSLTNVANLEQSDSYTREYINSLCSWFSSAGSTGDADFETLIELGNAGFNASYVKGSEIYQPEIMRRQVLEYMKYRAPVSISTSLLSKFSSFKGFGEQSAVLEKKVEYEEALDEIGEHCKNAYNAIKTCRDKSYSSTKDKGLDKYKLNYEAKVANAENVYKNSISPALVGYQLIDSKPEIRRDYMIDSNTLTRIKSLLTMDKLNYFKELATITPDEGKKVLDEETFFLYELEYIFNQIGLSGVYISSVSTKYTESGLETSYSYSYSYDSVNFPNVSDWNSSDITTCIPNCAAIIDRVAEWQNNETYTKNVNIGKALLNYIENFYTFNKDLFESESFRNDYESIGSFSSTGAYQKLRNSSDSFFYKLSKDFDPNGTLHTLQNNISNLKESIKNHVNTNARNVYNDLAPIYADAIAQEKNYTDAINKMNTVITKMEDAEKKGEAWNAKIQKVSDNGTRQSMTADYQKTADIMKSSEAKKLRDDVLKKNKAFFTDMKSKIESIEYVKRLCDFAPSGDNYFSQFIGKIDTPTANNYAGSETENNAKALFKKSADYKNYKPTDELIPNSTQEKNVPAEQKFWAYLIQLCAQEEGSSSTSKDNAKEGKKTLIEAGSSDKVKGTSNGKSLSNKVENNAAYKAAVEGGGALKENKAAVSNDDDNKKVAKNAGGQMNSQSDFLTSLGNLAKAAGEDIYINEYINKMFSCYTTNLTSEGEALKNDKGELAYELTLSGIELNAANNKYFGGEVEYILWGGDPQSAVNTNKACIFAVRFALNTIYAFTAPDIQALALEWATAIAGWTCFGIPIVQTVITIALALAESIYDLDMLCSGRSVPIYKSQDTWNMSPTGLVNMAKSKGQEVLKDVTEKAKSAADDKVTKLFDKIENSTVDKIGELGSDIDDYVDKSIKSVTDTIIASTITPFKNSISSMLYKIDSSWSKETIQSYLDAELDKLEAQLTDDGSTFYQGEKLAIAELRGYTGTIAAKITNKIGSNPAIDQLYQKLSEAESEINKFIDGVGEGEARIRGISEDISDKIRTKVDDLTKTAQKKIKDSLDSSEDKIKENLNSAIDNFSNNLTSNFNSSMDKLGSSAPEVSSSKNSENAKATTITLNYKEYLYAFSYIGLLANGDAMLQRSAYLMQMNICHSKRNTSFDITRAYTMVSVSADADVGASIIGVFKSESGPDGTKISLNDDFYYEAFTNGKTTNRIKYNGIAGY